MACCGAPGHLRSSKNGTRHFYHAVDTGCHYAGESKEHLAIKEQIYRTCRSEGWETSVEFPAPDRSWISDVYATRNGRKIVFEIQISAISPDELAERDEKYRNEGIESYWLLDNFLGRRRDFAAWYDSYLREEDGRHPAEIPYLDPSLFTTGPENHIFIPKGIRSVGLSAKKLTLFTTNNPAIPRAVWVREVLKGNYPRYLEETAAADPRKAPAEDPGSTGPYPVQGIVWRYPPLRDLPEKGRLLVPDLQGRCSSAQRGKHCRKSLTSSLPRSTGWRKNTIPLCRTVTACSRGKKSRGRMPRGPFSGPTRHQRSGNCGNAWRCLTGGKRLLQKRLGCWSRNSAPGERREYPGTGAKPPDRHPGILLFSRRHSFPLSGEAARQRPD